MEMNGLGNIVSTSSTLGGIDPASFPSWAGPLVDSTSQALTLSLMYAAEPQGRAEDRQAVELRRDRPEAAANFYELVQAQVRFAGDSGWRPATWTGVASTA
jgi:hypothetical protein